MMKLMRLIFLSLITLTTASCSESKRVFMQMNQERSLGRIFSGEEYLERAAYFTQQRDYYDATSVIEDAIEKCQMENNQGGTRKAHALLCKIYQDKGHPEDIYRYYNPDRARIACKKAGITMEEAKNLQYTASKLLTSDKNFQDGKDFMTIGKYKLAKEPLEAAMSSYESTHYETGIYQAARLLCTLYQKSETYDFERAKIRCKRAGTPIRTENNIFKILKSKIKEN